VEKALKIDASRLLKGVKYAAAETLTDPKAAERFESINCSGLLYRIPKL